MTKNNTLILLSAIVCLFIFPPGFFILGMLAAFNFIVRNLYGPKQQAKDAAALDGSYVDSELYQEQEQSPLQQTYGYLKRYLDAKNNAPRIVPRIETADLSAQEKNEWQRIIERLDAESK
jgi:hypothetical protein